VAAAGKLWARADGGAGSNSGLFLSTAGNINYGGLRELTGSAIRGVGLVAGGKEQGAWQQPVSSGREQMVG